mmetsp:Transcript_47324/g.86942  ORF Transcript_47324/g.86942 Transcript_47324/m.86942 type:complete len:82 (+) Transcript_47324:723-968(+)
MSSSEDKKSKGSGVLLELETDEASSSALRSTTPVEEEEDDDSPCEVLKTEAGTSTHPKGLLFLRRLGGSPGGGGGGDIVSG